MPRRLVRWSSNDSALGISPGHELVQPGDPIKVGLVTSVTLDPNTCRQVGLAYLKSSAVVVDSELLVGGGEPRIEHRVKISPLVNQ
jgi:glycine cleavage system aminomethyltransferase T